MRQVARGSAAPPIISSIQSQTGSPNSDPQDILNTFSTSYQELYSSHSTATTQDIESYLATIPLPCLSDTDRDYLDCPITLQEVIDSISSFHPAKSPGGDGLPVEFYKEYAEFLAPRLLEVYCAAFQSGVHARGYYYCLT